GDKGRIHLGRELGDRASRPLASGRRRASACRGLARILEVTRIEPVSGPAPEDLLAGAHNPTGYPHVGVVCSLEVPKIPTPMASLEAPLNLGMPSRNVAVVRYHEVALDAADRERVASNSDRLAVVVSVVENQEKRDTRSLHGAESRGVIDG